MKATTESIAALTAIAFLIAGLNACGPEHEAWEPLPEQISTRPLEEEARRALEHVRQAKSMIESSPDGAATEIAAAETALTHLSSYYLPLLEARAEAYNAYFNARAGEKELALEELSSAERILLRVADQTPHAAGLMKQTAEKLAEARVALAGGEVETQELLAELASLLNQAILKGPIEFGAE